MPCVNYLLYSVQGRNLFNNNSEYWDLIEGKILNVTVGCQSEIQFCILFRISANPLPGQLLVLLAFYLPVQLSSS